MAIIHLPGEILQSLRSGMENALYILTKTNIPGIGSMDTKVVKNHPSNVKAKCFSIYCFLPVLDTNVKLPAQLLGQYPDRTVSVTLARNQFAVLMSAEALKC